MTREEEIKNYAMNNCIQDDIDDTSYELIVETAKWADETMLDKARKMLYAMLDTHQDSYGYDYITAPAYDSVEEFVNDFCKAMEEGEWNIQ